MVDRGHLQFVGAAFLWVALIHGPSRAQDVDGVFLPAPRELEQRIRRAEKAIEEDQFGEAVMFLGGVLDGTADESGETVEDYFVTLEGNTKTSLKARAEQLIGSMPKSARDLYEVQYGAEAKRLLNQALESGNAESLSEVSSRYFHTIAGYESTMLLGRHYLRCGRPVAAAICFRRIASSPVAAARFEPAASFLLATAWRAAARDDSAREVLEQLRTRMRKATFEIDGQKVDSFSEGQDVLNWHQQVVGKLRIRGDAALDNWAMFRGSASRNATTSGSMPMASKRWHVPVGRDEPIDESYIDGRVNFYRKSATPAIPALHPLVVGEWVLFRTPDFLLGVELNSGKRIWPYPWDPWDDAMDRPSGSAPNNTAIKVRHQQLRQRIWEDSPYGQISSNGRAVFLLDDLGFSMRSPGQRVVIQPQNIRRTNPNLPKSYNALVALDIEKQGKMMWRVGGLQGEDEPRTAGAFFLGPPLPISSDLYAIAEVKGESKLIVLDAATGQLQWSQQLTHLENNNILRDGVRRMAGACPSFADGVLVCPTSAGAVVAVDVANRSLMWGYAYRRTNRLSSNNRRVFVGGRMVENYANPSVGKRWVDSTATIGAGSVVLTPVESSEMHCLDVLTGKKKWTIPRGDWLFVAAIHDGGVVVVGKTAVAKLGIEDGKEVWKMDLPERSVPGGIGFANADHYYLATTMPEILKIDLSRGGIASRLVTEETLGNLVAYRDQILSLSPARLTAFYQTERLDEIVKRKLQENPDDPEFLEHQARLLLKDGKRDEALASMRRAVKAYSQDDEGLVDSAKKLLVDTLLDMLRTSDKLDMNTVAELNSLMEAPQKHVEFQRLLAMAFHRSKDYGKAFDAYLKIADEYINYQVSLSISTRDAELEQVEKNRSVRRDRWLRHFIAKVLRDAGGSSDQMSSKLATRIEQVLTGDASTSSLRRFVSVFGDCREINPVKLRFAQRLLDDGEHIEAELVLTEVLESDVAAEAMVMMASMYEGLNKHDAAGECYRQLSARFPEHQAKSGETGEQLFRDHQRKYPAVAWPVGQVEVNRSSTTPMPRFPTEIKVSLRTKRGFAANGETYWAGRSNPVISAKDRFGQPTWSTTFGGTQGNRFASCYQLGHLLICSAGYDIVALDMLAANDASTREVWYAQVRDREEGAAGYRSLTSRPQPTDWGLERQHQSDGSGYRLGDVACLSPRGICVHVRDELRCIDPASGDVLWSRTDVPSDVEIWGDDLYVMVRGPNDTRASAYRLLDGEKLELKVDDVPSEPQTGHWLGTFGRSIVNWTTETDGASSTWRLNLFDPIRREEVWHRHFKPTSRADLMVESDELTVLEPDGKVTVISLKDGKEQLVGRVTLKQREKDILPVTGIHSFSFEDNVLVICRRTPRAILEGVAKPATRMQDSSQIADAEIHALQRGTGKLAWDAAVNIQQFELPLLQPPGLPIWFFGRNLSSRRNPAGELTIMGIDKRSGRRVFFEEKLTPKKENLQVAGDVARNTIVAQLPDDRIYRLLLTDKPLAEPKDQEGSKAEKSGITTISDFVEDFFGESEESKKRVPLAEDPFAPEK